MDGLKLPSLSGSMPWLVIGGGVLLLVMLAARKADLLPSVSSLAYDVGGAIPDAVDGVLSGVVVGTGSLFGLPQTNQTQCRKDLAAGEWWKASFSCPASDFIGAGYDKITG